MGSVESDCWKACAVPWNPPWMVEGMPILVRALSMAAVACESETLGARLNESVVAGEMRLVVDGERDAAVLKIGDGGERDLRAGRGFDVDVAELRGVVLVVLRRPP